MSFIRHQEEKLAMRFLQWRYQNLGLPIPPPQDLEKQVVQLVEDAHRIARERGRNIVSIMKDLATDLKDKNK